MSDQELFMVRRLPGRLTAAQASLLLGFSDQEVSILVRHGLLRPLGRPAPNGHKYFSSAEIEKFSRDREFLDRASRIIVKSVREKNVKRLENGSVASSNCLRGNAMKKGNMVPAGNGGSEV